MSAHLFDERMVESAELVEDVISDGSRVLQEVFVFDDGENFQSATAHERCSAEGGSVRAWSEKVAERDAVTRAQGDLAVGDPDGADGQPASQSLRPGNSIGFQVWSGEFPSVPVSGSAESRLDLIEHQEEVALFGESSGTCQKIAGSGTDPTFTLDGLGEDGCCGSIFEDGGPEGGEVVERDVLEPLRERIKTVTYLLLACGSNPCERASVEGVQHRVDGELCWRSGVLVACGLWKRVGEPDRLVAEFARQFVKRLVRFSAGVAEKNFSVPAHEADDPLCEECLWAGQIEVGDVEEFVRLFGDGEGQPWVSMAH